MDPLTHSVAAIAVASIYFVYRSYFQFMISRQRVLRERVAYMLWVSSDYVR